MAYNPSLRVDDVIKATKGQQVIADRKYKLVIPAAVSASGKREVHELDVSEEGHAEIKRREEAAVASAKKAYEPVTSVVRKL